eukprot:CAMPEP_0201485964 /NCGR_PEP_ID=MMETSP0151_2-20130828/10027_1 /ASSEMBLY_ACC=CAM_ASM_000257 /TAXON_ID=200890 /ORGANISM="Paramoeba atlantica, Strain 621/1 / CCAP 1560/9" /LENGTH=203 /DNA_ID=CAMNT_0047870319 /DNA_START=146 /DNA_END=757 /DNA_ORIENTATION=+
MAAGRQALGQRILLPGMITKLNGLGGPPKPLSKIMFEKYDKDNSGSIDEHEFRELTQELGYHLNEKQMKWAMSHIDHSGDGNIEYEEFMKWWRKEDRVKHLQLSDEAIFFRAEANLLFKEFDDDNSGALDRAEFKQFYKKLVEKGLTSEEVGEEKALQELDRDGDGEVQFNEFMEWLQSHNQEKIKTFLPEFLKSQSFEAPKK